MKNLLTEVVEKLAHEFPDVKFKPGKGYQSIDITLNMQGMVVYFEEDGSFHFTITNVLSNEEIQTVARISARLKELVPLTQMGPNGFAKRNTNGQ